MKTLNLRLTCAIVMALALIGCGKKSASPEVKVQMTNNTASVLAREMKAVGPRGILPVLRGAAALQDSLQGETPLIYKMKFVAIYLVEAIDEVTGDNRGDGTLIWANSKCDSGLHQCGIDPDHSNGYTPDYFDFSGATEAVNKELNGFVRDTPDKQLGAGTYNYLRMDFTGIVRDFEDTTPNLMFGIESAHEVRAQKQAYTIALPEPLVIAEGQSFTVNLAYDLEKRFYESAAHHSPPAEVGEQKWTCAGEGNGVPCIVEAEFNPTVTKNK